MADLQTTNITGTLKTNDKIFTSSGLLAFGSIYTNTEGPNKTQENIYVKLSDNTYVTGRVTTIKNYRPGIISYSSNDRTFTVSDLHLVDYIKITYCVGGYFNSTNAGIWFRDEWASLPSGVTNPFQGRMGLYPTNASSSYGGAIENFIYLVNTTDTTSSVKIDPYFASYWSTLAVSGGGLPSYIVVEVWGSTKNG